VNVLRLQSGNPGWTGEYGQHQNRKRTADNPPEEKEGEEGPLDPCRAPLGAKTPE